jgi:ribonuclease J
MMETLEVAKVLGYLKYPKDLVHDAARMSKTHDRETLILTTGSQGEDVSALSRIGLGNHQTIRIKKGDTVVLSSSPIIGNERAVSTVINNLCRLGAKVIHNKMMDVHTSGHANAEDLKLMITLVHPKYLVPVHGEYFMRQGHMELGFQLGMKKENGVLVENGDVIEFKNGIARITGEKISTNYVLVDGLGTGDVGTQVIMDRQTMAENGVLVVLLSLDKKTNKLLRDPDIISRGFIYMNESEEVMARVAKEAKEIFTKSMNKKSDMKRGELKNALKLNLEKSIHRMIERRPLILPVIAELGHGNEHRELPSNEHHH